MRVATKSRLTITKKGGHAYIFALSQIACAFVAARSAYADTYFNPAFLSPDAASVADLSRFEQGKQQAGIYQVDISVNNQFFATKNMKFVDANVNADDSASQAGGLQPCLDKNWLSALGINTSSMAQLAKYSSSECLPVQKLIPASVVDYNFADQKLNLSFPQAWLANSARGYIPPSQWDNGVPALLLNYSLSADKGSTGQSNFLSLGSGFNLGAWRLRNNSSWTYDNYKEYTSNKWSNIDTYLERAVIGLKSELVIGESNTSNDIYDSVGFRGIRLYSDESMYPDSLQGFAPTIHGIANSRSKVVIRQNGYVIYQTYVSPGPFTINDLSPTSSSGDLTVSVQGSDGAAQTFIVPYSTLPLLQRTGRIKYDLIAGNFRSGSDDQDDPFFAQGTIIAGLGRGLTFYGGTQLAAKYQAFTGGIGKNMGDFGAVSLDWTQAKSRLSDGDHYRGQSLHFMYAKSHIQSGTTFQFAGYRYSHQGFYTLEDVAYKNTEGYEYGLEDEGYGNETYTATSYHNLGYAKKARYQININQSLGRFGSMYASISQQSYWGLSAENKTYQLGYSNSWRSINYTLSWSSTESVGIADTDHVASINFSIPMSSLLGHAYPDSNSVADRMYITSNASRNSDGTNSMQSGVSGTLLDEGNLSYSLMQGQSATNGESGNANTQLQGSYGTAALGYSYAKGTHDYTLQVAGGVVAHRNGMTLSQPLGETNILVKAPGAADVSVENKTGVATDFRGYTVVPYADVYRLNRIALDTNTMNSETDITDNVRNVVPTRGALVLSSFDTHIGVRMLITLEHNHHPVPFGASVQELNSDNASIVGDDGLTYLSGMPQNGKLKVQWGSSGNERCTADYQIRNMNKQLPIYNLTEACQ